MPRPLLCVIFFDRAVMQIPLEPGRRVFAVFLRVLWRRASGFKQPRERQKHVVLAMFGCGLITKMSLLLLIEESRQLGVPCTKYQRYWG